MKVLVISTNAIAKNGVTGVIYNLLDNMDKTNLTFDLQAINEPERSYIRRIEDYGGEFDFIERRTRNKNPLVYISKLSRRIKKGGYDIVHVHGNSHTLCFELIAAALAGCPIRIAHSHNTTSNDKSLHKLLTPLFDRLCTHRLACGKDAGKWMFGKKSFEVINNGVDIGRFGFDLNKREKIRAELGVSEDCVLLLNIGVCIEQKNQTFLIDVLKNLKDAGRDYKLLIIGSGRLLPGLKEKVKMLELEQTVLFLEKTDCPEAYFSASDLVVMPSLYEGLPITLIEAQTNGLRCLVSDRITREVDKTGNLQFITIDNGPELWVQQIVQAEVPTLKQRKIFSEDAARSMVDSGYDIKIEAKKVKDFYYRAVGKK